jgi:CDP-glycerol glycerophosphotransferase
LNGDAAFQDRLAAENITLYVKPHPRITTNVQSSGHIVILENLDEVDSQELISVADVLITDYSSVFIDFALLERPLHFFVPDLEQYQKNANGLFFSFSEFSEFWFKEYADFKSAIINCHQFADFGLKNSEKVNSIYNDPNLDKGHYCEAVIREIEKL